YRSTSGNNRYRYHGLYAVDYIHSESQCIRGGRKFHFILNPWRPDDTWVSPTLLPVCPSRGNTGTRHHHPPARPCHLPIAKPPEPSRPVRTSEAIVPPSHTKTSDEQMYRDYLEKNRSATQQSRMFRFVIERIRQANIIKIHIPPELRQPVRRKGVEG